jgi:DNA adenine methylase
MARTQTLPLIWFGGKSALAKQIVAAMPPHVHYVEPFFGSGAVLFAKPESLIEGHSELINDLNGELMNFWRVLQSPSEFKKLSRILSVTPLSSVQFAHAKTTGTQGTEAERAAKLLVRCRQSMNGRGDSFCGITREGTSAGMNKQASAWLSAIEGLPAARDRLKRVVIKSQCAMKLIEREDSATTFFYLDPPYLQETRVTKKVYQHEMSNEQHEQLLKTLSRISGKFILSGYPSELYDSFAKRRGWNQHSITVRTPSSKTRNRPSVERFWRNF